MHNNRTRWPWILIAALLVGWLVQGCHEDDGLVIRGYFLNWPCEDTAYACKGAIAYRGIFRVFPEQQQVVAMFAIGEPQKYTDCAIFNRENWTCMLGGQTKTGFRAGEFFMLSMDNTPLPHIQTTSSWKYYLYQPLFGDHL